MKRALILAAVLALVLPTATLAARPDGKGNPHRLTAATGITIDPAQPAYGDELTVTGPSTNNVFNVQCSQDGTLVYSDGGNALDPTVTLAGLSWTGGGADCIVNAREYNPQTGDVETVASLTFQVTDSLAASAVYAAGLTVQPNPATVGDSVTYQFAGYPDAWGFHVVSPCREGYFPSAGPAGAFTDAYAPCAGTETVEVIDAAGGVLATVELVVQ